jgi:hypothetical protein
VEGTNCTRRGSRLVWVGFLAALVALGLPASVGATNDLQVRPTSGGPKNTFTFQFTAPLSVPPGEYDVDVTGPVGCSYAGAYWNSDVTVGQSLSLPLDASYIHPYKARQWCIGRYSGSVYWYRKGQPNATVGRVGFVVHGPAKYSGTSDQGYVIGFTVTRQGRWITELRLRLKLWCSAYGITVGRSLTLHTAPGHGIRLKKGKFNSHWSSTSSGMHSRSRLWGSLVGGRFKGGVRLRGDGRSHGIRVACDSGAVRWTAR